MNRRPYFRIPSLLTIAALMAFALAGASVVIGGDDPRPNHAEGTKPAEGAKPAVKNVDHARAATSSQAVGGEAVYSTASEPDEGPAPAAASTPIAHSNLHGKHAATDDLGACVTGAAIEDLNRLRDRLAEREKAISAKEAELKTLEKAIQEEFAKLEQTRSDLAKVDDLKKKENEEKIAKIVETLESMSPKPASQLIGTMDEALAVTAIRRMSTQKLAKIMNVMESGKSSRLTELLAGSVRTKSSAPLLASSGTGATSGRNPTSNPAEKPAGSKGGEKK